MDLKFNKKTEKNTFLYKNKNKDQNKKKRFLTICIFSDIYASGIS